MFGRAAYLTYLRTAGLPGRGSLRASPVMVGGLNVSLADFPGGAGERVDLSLEGALLEEARTVVVS